MINHAVMGVFDKVDTAEQARAALLADGFGSDALELKVHDDEAGPVEGNFLVGNTPIESDQHVYDRNYANPVQRGQCILMVNAADAATAACASAILAGLGARDPDRLSGARPLND
ncbi:hypothetical protein [Massilia antarctica]|uniref:hypothetical protein n=1 Tax=Massilia antarctica TaxID=2765360 RepID=UPI0006BB7513|nr:hypothetical protein [Massilia sp. H27-R4]MCY0912565.1 hypothetical protein [Massilia sp. H27-R4]CUI03618.1 hypothetical protein BN2497_2013 [Janthinobacterium sp. CG23_2]CUU27404.1 hypothetical protein BN3177_2013 [Janthinobacterium sp. CG23_2]